MIPSRLRRHTLPLFIAILLNACGGGSADPQPTGGCTLQSTGGCGGTLPAPVVPPVTTPLTPPDPASLASSVRLLFSSTELPSSGVAGSEVGVTALVKDAANLALPNAKISFAADSGLLASVDAVTDRNGQARAVLGTGGDKHNRSIKVTARVGSQAGSGAVAVTGTTVQLAGPSLLATGQQADLVVTVRDSARQPVSGAAIRYSGNGATGLTVRDGAATVSNAQGQLLLRLAAGAPGNNAVSASALGASVSHAYTVAGGELRLSPAVGLDASGAELPQEVPAMACQPIDVRYESGGVARTGSASLSTSRGTLHADSACAAVLPSSLIFTNGSLPTSYVRSAYAGMATITAAVAGGPTAQTRLEFIAPLSSASKLSVQAGPAVLGPNAFGATDSIATISAVVRDGAANNLVKHAPVLFTILSDASGGYLRQTGRVLTDAGGLAQAVYVAGPADSGRDGVLIQASIDGASQAAATAQVRLTVAKKALSIKFGTGNNVREYSSSVLQKDIAVFVSDSAGNAVAGVAITAAGWPSRYGKGYFVWEADKPDFPDTGAWRLALPRYSCANEDVLRNGIFELAYDLNGNGVLDPGIALTVSASGQTDALGLATVTISYPRNYGAWLQLALSVRGSVAGTEAASTMEITLPTLSTDFSVRRVPPPGQTSPYGTGSCDSAQ
ncbi:Ig-like domain-containing protein [Janthinobacterium psychrotolerans]|uniref:Ig-like domain (Group 1) n=1 Tax=Janthinobacterium psychrotolerans TaxID=1747903 RepID=A0A1A7BWB0_9BURK|nr:Ig-like domain-containing protein [Janthinobacterium psychrotolerans]OBV37861.1 hypothetical protein ASR47_1004136 [Janthinobacterium psychrotolerans]